MVLCGPHYLQRYYGRYLKIQDCRYWTTKTFRRTIHRNRHGHILHHRHRALRAERFYQAASATLRDLSSARTRTFLIVHHGHMKLVQEIPIKGKDVLRQITVMHKFRQNLCLQPYQWRNCGGLRKSAKAFHVRSGDWKRTWPTREVKVPGRSPAGASGHGQETAEMPISRFPPFQTCISRIWEGRKKEEEYIAPKIKGITGTDVQLVRK